MTAELDLDALERGVREGDVEDDERYPFRMGFDDALALIAELRVARVLVEQARSMWIDGNWDKATVRAALDDYDSR